MKTTIPYGDLAYTAELSDHAVSLAIKEPEPIINPALFRQSLVDEFKQHSFDLSNTVIVVTDKTRVCGYPTYLPVLIEVLEEFGLGDGGLRFIIAYGTHPRQSDAECRACYGETYEKYPFIHHQCDDPALFVDCGVTSRGTPVRLRKDIMEVSCLITMGPIVHHYFAGYGGGRKLIFPGCGERESIYANHSLYLDRDGKQLAPSCQPGILENNPLADDLFEVAEKKAADLAIHGIMDSHGNLCDVIVGSGKKKYLEACRRHGEHCETSSPSFPVVIASCGGYPKDINFIQSHKALHNAAMFVEDGGTLLIFSECREGVGSPTFLPWFELGGFSHAYAHLCDNYQGNGGTALATMAKTARIRIIMVTELEEEICIAIGIEKWSYGKAFDYMVQLRESFAYIANASLLVRKSVP